MKSPEFYVWSESEDRDPEDIDKPIKSGYIKRKGGVGLISFDEYEDHVDLFCPHCEQYSDTKNRLGARILEKDKPIPEDHSSWLQCYKCGNIYGTHEIAHESDIRDTVETLDCPFEVNETTIESVPKRTSKAGQRDLSKRRKERDRPHHKDADIDREMQRHGDRVTVVYDSDP